MDAGEDEGEEKEEMEGVGSEAETNFAIKMEARDVDTDFRKL